MARSNNYGYDPAPQTTESCILLVRGQKVMVDADLAELYGVPIKYCSAHPAPNFANLTRLRGTNEVQLFFEECSAMGLGEDDVCTAMRQNEVLDEHGCGNCG